MKSDHRHELKTNELADWIAHLPQWVRENRTTLTAVGAVVLVALIVYFMSFYRRNVASTRTQTRLTSLVSEVPQKISTIANAAAQNRDESYILLQTEQDLQNFAQKASDSDMAALALIQRGAALRAEVHYRLSEINHDDFVKQMDAARASYQEALDRKPSSPGLTAAAQYGLGLCAEELGEFDKAAQTYREVAEKKEYTGTTAQAAAAYRLKIMDEYRTEVTFQPAPPKPAQATTPTIQIQPGAATSPTVVAPAVPEPNAGAALPSSEMNLNVTPAAETPTPAPAATPGQSDANAPQGG